MNHREVIEACYDEWREMHHNASLSRRLPDFQNEYEYHLFWSCLGDETHWAIEDLSEQIEEKWGWKLKFYSYGRQGATIAPDKWMLPPACNSFGGFAAHKALENLSSGLEGYNHDRQVLAVLEFINNYWEKQVEYCSEWWTGMKEGNEHFQELIDEHEGMTLVTREVWVKEED